jgi:hypothetical protein
MATRNVGKYLNFSNQNPKPRLVAYEIKALSSAAPRTCQPVAGQQTTGAEGTTVSDNPPVSGGHTAPHARHRRPVNQAGLWTSRGISIFDIRYAPLKRFDIKFASLSKYDTGHANCFKMRDFSSFFDFTNFYMVFFFIGPLNYPFCP